MKKEVTAIFTLTNEEVKEALYDMFVRKLKSHNMNAIFSKDEIFIQSSLGDVCITVTETKELE